MKYTRFDLVTLLARGFAHVEGFFLTPAECRSRRIKYPTLARMNCNPGNVRAWARHGNAYPTTRGYVDFVKWARLMVNPSESTAMAQMAIEEGWRVLCVLLDQYVDGKYHSWDPPDLYQVTSVYAPNRDNNNPKAYAETVQRITGIQIDVPLHTLICDQNRPYFTGLDLKRLF